MILELLRRANEVVRKKEEAVLIIKPRNEEEKSKSDDKSEMTKNDIKNNIEISKLGIGVTKMKKVTNGAVVVGCENKVQADKLKEKVEQDLGNRYVIHEPRKKKPKIKIYDVDKEDSDGKQEFWRKIEEQNGFKRNMIKGKILHRTVGTREKGITILAEMDDEASEKLLNLGKLKIGWKLCKVQEYIGLLRCFKCCGCYHFGKNCDKKETCGNCWNND